MKQLLLAVALMMGLQVVQAQTVALVDKSPLDQVYFPEGYPSLKLRNTKEELKMRVIYSRPFKNNRAIFGAELVPYGKVWRLGANEATEIDFFTAVKVGNTKIPAGRYTLYAIPAEKEWTFIINKETDIWGAFKYEASKDLVRVTVPVKELEKPVDPLTIGFEKNKTGANLVVAWDTTSATLPISF